MSFAQWLPKNHLEVLDGHPDRKNTSLPRQLYYPGMAALTFLGASIFRTTYGRRPILSGLPVHAAFIAAGAFLGYSVDNYRRYLYTENEARMRHYIETHKDDFPDYEMVKIGEVLEPWIPVR